MNEPAVALARGSAVQGSSLSSSLPIIMASLPLLVLLSALYSTVLIDLFWQCWNDPAASQGLLIPPLAAYLAYLRWNLVTDHVAQIEGAGLSAVAGGAILLVLGRLGSELFVARISFVLVAAGIIWTFWGLPRLRALSLPLLLLASMIPLPALVYGTLSVPLQLFASSSAETIAELAGVTLYREGNTLFLANITLGVEEACSGLTSLSSILIAALLFSYIFCTRPLARVLIIFSAIPVAIAANVIRVAGTAVLSDRQPAYALGFYHAFSGWVVFVIALLALYVVATTFRSFTEQ